VVLDEEATIDGPLLTFSQFAPGGLEIIVQHMAEERVFQQAA